MRATETLRKSGKPMGGIKGTKDAILHFMGKQQRSLSALVFFVVMILIFTFFNPRVLLNPVLWNAVFISLPLSIILSVALVFLVAAGEIDLSFGSVIAMAGWAFAVVFTRGWGPIMALIAALLTGIVCGLVNGLLVTRLKLSSLVATLGMQFLLRGLVNIGNQGFPTKLTAILDTPFQNAITGDFHGFPIQMFWGLAFATLSWWLFNRHQFGAHICCVGDNPDSAREMGINVTRVKIMAFVYVGLAAAIVGVITNLINTVYYPTSGDGFMLPVLAAVFVGGTPTWGGIGTILGATIGSFTVNFIETGVIAAGGTSFYTEFFYGLIVILSLITHRFNRSKTRY